MAKIRDVSRRIVLSAPSVRDADLNFRSDELTSRNETAATSATSFGNIPPSPESAPCSIFTPHPLSVDGQF